MGHYVGRTPIASATTSPKAPPPGQDAKRAGGDDDAADHQPAHPAGAGPEDLPPQLMRWLVVCGVVIAAGTLGVLAWADGAFGDVVARTMGVTTFALFRLFSSLETADADESLFSGSILSNSPLLIATGISIGSIILATELGFLQRILGTVSLSPDQWAVCILVSLSIVVAEELRKLFNVRVHRDPIAVPAPAAAA